MQPIVGAVDTPPPETAMQYIALPATPNDIVELVVLMEAFYAESGYTLDRAWARRSFERLIDNPDLGVTWVVRQGHSVVGHVVLTQRFSMEYGGIDAFVDDLYIDPVHRRRGAGHAALSAVVAECRRRGVLALHVEVGQDNSAANALYARWGLLAHTDGRLTLTKVFDPVDRDA